MNNSQPIPPTSQHYLVWFASGADPEQLLHLPDTIQLQQDVLVVTGSSDHDALEKAASLLRHRCEFPAFITKVMDRSELLRSLAVLELVDAGKLEPASLSDESHLDWAERFLYTDYTSSTGS